MFLATTNSVVTFYPASGDRDGILQGGALHNITENGFAWSASFSAGYHVLYQFFYAIDTRLSYAGNRVYGFPVRCSQEFTPQSIPK